MTDETNQKPNFYDLYKTVGKIDGKIDGILDHLKRINGRLDNQDTRLNAVEKECDEMKGKAGMIGGFVGFLVSIIGWLISLFKK